MKGNEEVPFTVSGAVLSAGSAGGTSALQRTGSAESSGSGCSDGVLVAEILATPEEAAARRRYCTSL